MDRSSTDDLGAQLSRANSKQLLELIGETRELTPRQVFRALRNPFVTAEAIEALLAVRGLLSSYQVRSAIARHRRTPETVALRFVSGLYWRDLLEISVDMRISPAVRRVAEKYLIQRLGRLTVGEKMAIARRAAAGVLARLRSDPSLHVIKALLQNPRLTEAVLLPMVASESTLPRVLDLIAREPRWGTRYEIRLALSRNTRSPFRVILEILPGLRRQDLITVANQESHSGVIKRRAGELLAGTEIGARARRNRP